jgi:hypothetical protein
MSPAKSVKQQQFMAMVDQGKIPAPPGLTKKVAEEFASTSTKGLPAHVRKPRTSSKMLRYKELMKKGPEE